jgi:hypothetical protein
MPPSRTARTTDEAPGGGAAAAAGRRGAGAAPVTDGGHGLLLAEPGASGERLVEPVGIQCLTDLGDQLGFVSAQQRPACRPPVVAEVLGQGLQR